MKRKNIVNTVPTIALVFIFRIIYLMQKFRLDTRMLEKVP
jgi:hypothetical protein